MEFKKDNFKKAYGKKDHGIHNQLVGELKKEIVKKFPKLSKAIKGGFGTDTIETVEYHASEKFDPALTICPKGEVLCYIRVVHLKHADPKKGGLWVLEKKYLSDKEKNEKTWYYFKEFFGDGLILDIASIKNYEDKGLLKSPTKMYQEYYFVLPYTLSKNESNLFWWIEKELKEKFPEYV